MDNTTAEFIEEEEFLDEEDEDDDDSSSDEDVEESVEEMIEKTLKTERDTRNQDDYVSVGSQKSKEERLAMRPDTSKLISAVAHLSDGTPVFVPEVGEKVIIDRSAGFLKGTPWIETRIWRVLKIDETTGVVHLYCDDMKQFGGTNYITGPSKGDLLFLPPKNRVNSVGRQKMKRKRTRKVKQKPEQTIPVPVETQAKDNTNVEETKKPGRKAGIKNRPKDVIKAEREAREKEREAKRQARKLARESKR